MIIIWDNGCDYEDHDVNFIDAGDLEHSEAEAILRLTERYGRILGDTPSIRWVGDGGSPTLADYMASASIFKPMNCDEECAIGCNCKERIADFKATLRDVPTTAIEAAVKTSGGCEPHAVIVGEWKRRQRRAKKDRP